MTGLAIFIFFILGTIVGSFLNVVIYRYNSSASPLHGRSQCLSCGKVLTPFELIPVLSFIAMRGRCAGCGVRISWQYIIVEILTGIIFAATFVLGKSMVETTLLIAIFSTLIVIAVYDMRHQIIPDGLVALFGVLGLVKFFVLTGTTNIFQTPHMWTLAAGPVLFLPFWLLWLVSRGRWIGLGDGKLALGIGWFLGLSAGGTAIILAFWIGAGVALAIMGLQHVFKHSTATHSVWGRALSVQSAVPFGPLLILAIFIVYFTRVNFFDPYGIFYLPL